MTVVNVLEKLSVLIKDVDKVVIKVLSQDSTLAVRCDAVWTKWSLGREEDAPV